MRKLYACVLVKIKIFIFVLIDLLTCNLMAELPITVNGKIMKKHFLGDCFKEICTPKYLHR